MAEQKGAPPSTGADETSLRDDLAAAFDATPEPEDQDGGVALPTAPDGGDQVPPAEGDQVADAAGRVRDPVTKRFVKQQSTEINQSLAQKQQEGIQGISPPPGYSPTSKARWADVPQFIKEDISKREREMSEFVKPYHGLKQYVDQAVQSGTTLPEALQRYVAAEQLLEREPVKGILWLCNNYGIDPRQLVQASGGQPQQPQPGAPAGPNGQQPYPGFDIRQQLDPVVKQLNDLTKIVQGGQQEKVFSEVDTFFRDTKAHPYVENVAEEMARLLNTGAATSLQQAYDAACWTNEEVRGLLINDITTAQSADQANKAQRVADQARRAGQSITGGPAATPAAGAPDTDNLREQLQANFRAGRVM